MNLFSRRLLAWLVVITLLLPSLPIGLSRVSAQPRAQSAPQPVTSHPRIFLTVDDLPRLQSWATDSNPMWRDGILVLADRMRADMDEGRVPTEDTGGRNWSPYPTESYAEFFAFLSLIHPDEATRADYQTRSRTLLMYAINEAAKGPDPSEPPFRSPDFVTPHSDRLRWWGESWALTVDWIYPALTVEDKATIRSVFLRWSEEIVTQGYNHPEPIGVTNDPGLLANKLTLRWAGNNYFLSHMRNLGFMALALDPADDPGGELGAYLDTAIGAHLYMADHLLRNDSAGGLAPEGFEYSPQAIAYIAQFLLALQTTGHNDAAKWGDQVRFESNPFWDQVIPAFLHSLSPQRSLISGYEDLGPAHQPAWYGDGEKYWAPDMILLLGPMGRYADLTGDMERLDAIRWVETNTPPGGAETLISERVVYASGSFLIDAIFYFMLFDPAAPAPTDPRPNIILTHFAPGIGRFLARTGWDDDAEWFTYGLGWVGIDHQNGDGNMFAFYRNGEWLTKGLVGYGGEYGDEDSSDDWYYPSSDQQNTLALENDEPLYSNVPTDYRSQLYARGSQWEYIAAGDPTILAMSVAPGYTYALGDATNLYNSVEEGSMDILHASRSIVWLAPDTIVVYDRAESKTDGRFKRFWLNLLTDATVEGKRTTMTTEKGNQLVIDTLLPSDAVPVAQPSDNPLDSRAENEPMTYEFLVEAPGRPNVARFLHVLQGADAEASAPEAIGIESADGTFAGAVVGTTAVLFPVDLGAEIGEIQYTVPAATTTHLITGLTPGGQYDIVTDTSGGQTIITINAGTGSRANGGGVLLVGELPEILDTTFSFTNPLIPVVQADATPVDSGTIEETPVGDENPEATAEPGSESPSADATAAPVEGGAAASGEGQIVYEAVDSASGNRHLYRVNATEGATPEDVSVSLDALGSPLPDEWIGISPDGEWLLLGTERFDPECAGWPCLAVVPSDLSAGETVKVAGAAVHPDGFGAIASGGNAIVYPTSGPHPQDLWLITRDGDVWSDPVLLTSESLYDFNHTATFSADGTHVVFDCGNQPYAAEGTAICEVGVDGADFRVVMTPADAPSDGSPVGALHHPDYAPDGSIVFQATWNEAIWQLTSGETVPVQIAPSVTNDNAPCVLADGRVASLWYGRAGNEGVAEVKVMTADGSGYAMLVTGVHVEDIACGG